MYKIMKEKQSQQLHSHMLIMSTKVEGHSLVMLMIQVQLLCVFVELC